MKIGGSKIIGISAAEGEYEGRAFDNVTLQCTYKDDKTAGEAVERIKMKRVVYELDPVNIGDVIDPNYDQYGRVKSLTVMERWQSEKDKKPAASA